VEMLTGNPPLHHLEPSAAMFKVATKTIELTLPESVSQDAKDFITAALTKLVLLIAGIMSYYLA